MTNHRILWDTYSHRSSRTKDEILRERVAFLLREAKKIVATLEDETPCGLRCSGCGTVLATESDFAKHFIVTDEAHLNLGECPKCDFCHEVGGCHHDEYTSGEQYYADYYNSDSYVNYLNSGR